MIKVRIDGQVVHLPTLKGVDGKSAYQYAVDAGFEGTEQEFINLLIEGTDVINTHLTDSASHSDIRNLIDALGINKVDKVEGMGLSSNDFTDELKEKLENALSGKDGKYRPATKYVDSNKGTTINDLIEEGTYRIKIPFDSDTARYLGIDNTTQAFTLLVQTFTDSSDSVVVQIITRIYTGKVYFRYTTNQTNNPLSFDTQLVFITGDAATKGILNNTAKSHLGYDAATAQNLVPTISTIAWWNGAFNNTNNSNLAYCVKGAFGDAAVRGVDAIATKDSTNLITSGAMYTALDSKLSANATAANSSKLSGKSLLRHDATDTWEGIPYIDFNGIIEVGKHIDFHVTDDNTKNYDVRITATEDGLTLGGKTNLSIASPLKLVDDGGVVKNIISVYNPTPTSPISHGSEMVIGAGGNTFIGGGEGCTTLRDHLVNILSSNGGTLADELAYKSGDEQMYIIADTNLWLYSNCDTVSDRKGILFSKDGELVPLHNGVYNIGNAKYAWNAVYANKINNYTLGDACSKGILNNTTKSHLGYDKSTAQDLIPTISTIAYWDGTFDNTNNSNLTYCIKGAFGDAAVKNVDTTLTYGSSNLVTSGGVFDTLTEMSLEIWAELGKKLSVDGAAAKVKSAKNISDAFSKYIALHGYSDDDNNVEMEYSSKLRLTSNASSDTLFVGDGSRNSEIALTNENNWTTFIAAAEGVGNGINTVALPAKSGTLALTSGNVESASTIFTKSATFNGEYYRIPIHSDDSNKNMSLLNNSGFTSRIRTGTQSNDGYVCLNLGNSVASGTDGNLYGAINMYGKGQYLTQILASATTVKRTVTLPDADGTLAIASSDIRLKDNMKDTEVNALSVVNSIKFKQFDWKETGEHQEIGVIADELEELDKHLVLKNTGGYYDHTDDDGNPIMNVKCVDTFYLMGYYGKAIQELSAENDKLKSELAELKELVSALINK